MAKKKPKTITKRQDRRNKKTILKWGKGSSSKKKTKK